MIQVFSISHALFKWRYKCNFVHFCMVWSFKTYIYLYFKIVSLIMKFTINLWVKIVHKLLQCICFTISVYKLKMLWCCRLCDITLKTHDVSYHQSSLFSWSMLEVFYWGRSELMFVVEKYKDLLFCKEYWDSAARTVWVKCLPWEINQMLFYGAMCNFNVISSFSWIWTNFMVV